MPAIHSTILRALQNCSKKFDAVTMETCVFL